MQILEIARRPREDGPGNSRTGEVAIDCARCAQSGTHSENVGVFGCASRRNCAEKKNSRDGKNPDAAAQPHKGSIDQADDIEALKRQREALEKRLAEANSKLATARLSEKVDRDQQFERLQVIESPSLPQKPEKSDRLKFVAMAFAAAAMLGIGIVIAAELLDGSIVAVTSCRAWSLVR